ncbi:hypothetical protein D3C85_1463020 [compost metagenome]
MPDLSARTAPSSSVSEPPGAMLPAIHCFQAASGVAGAVIRVARAPSATACKGWLVRPEAMTVAQPAERAIWAAASLVAMPPVPTPASALAPVAMPRMSGPRLSTRPRWRASGSRRGSAV